MHTSRRRTSSSFRCCHVVQGYEVATSPDHVSLTPSSFHFRCKSVILVTCKLWGDDSEVAQSFMGIAKQFTDLLGRRLTFSSPKRSFDLLNRGNSILGG